MSCPRWGGQFLQIKLNNVHQKGNDFMKVKRNTLLLIACVVWSAAGFNILRIGIAVYPAYITLVNLLLSVLVFAVFQKFIFGRLVKKHTARIKGYEEERQFFLKFFDGKAFVIMAVMMSGGIGLRASGVAPEPFIAVFYSGLGASLLLAGLLFGRNYGRAIAQARRAGATGENCYSAAPANKSSRP